MFGRKIHFWRLKFSRKCEHLMMWRECKLSPFISMDNLILKDEKNYEKCWFVKYFINQTMFRSWTFHCHHLLTCIAHPLFVEFWHRYRWLQVSWRSLPAHILCRLHRGMFGKSSVYVRSRGFCGLGRWWILTKIRLKVYDPITFGFIHRNGVFGIRWKLLFFSFTPVKYDIQQMLILKVT